MGSDSCVHLVKATKLLKKFAKRHSQWMGEAYCVFVKTFVLFIFIL